MAFKCYYESPDEDDHIWGSKSLKTPPMKETFGLFLSVFSYSSSITHIVSENNSGDEVQAWLDNQTGRDTSSSACLLDIRWFTESMEAGHPVTVQDRHTLQVQGQIYLLGLLLWTFWI